MTCPWLVPKATTTLCTAARPTQLGHAQAALDDHGCRPDGRSQSADHAADRGRRDIHNPNGRLRGIWQFECLHPWAECAAELLGRLSLWPVHAVELPLQTSFSVTAGMQMLLLKVVYESGITVLFEETGIAFENETSVWLASSLPWSVTLSAWELHRCCFWCAGLFRSTLSPHSSSCSSLSATGSAALLLTLLSIGVLTQ